MPEQDDDSKWKSSTDGERAWKQERERIAERNDAARKAGKQERDTQERERAAVRRAAATKRDAGL